MKETLHSLGQGYKKFSVDVVGAGLVEGVQYMSKFMSSGVLNVLYKVFNAPIWLLDMSLFFLDDIIYQNVVRVIILEQLVALAYNVVLKARDIIGAVLKKLALIFELPLLVLGASSGLIDMEHRSYKDVFGAFRLFGVNVLGKNSIVAYLSYAVDVCMDFIRQLARHVTEALMTVCIFPSFFSYCLLGTVETFINGYLISEFEFNNSSNHVFWQAPLAIVLVPLSFVLGIMRQLLEILMSQLKNLDRCDIQLSIDKAAVAQNLNPFNVLGCGSTLRPPAGGIFDDPGSDPRFSGTGARWIGLKAGAADKGF